MNGTEQRTHRTVTTQLATAVEDIATTAAIRLDNLERSIGEERTHRIKLAVEQRVYVDNEDRILRQCCQERWDSTSTTTKQLSDRIHDFQSLSFWGRVRWLMRGA